MVIEFKDYSDKKAERFPLNKLSNTILSGQGTQQACAFEVGDRVCFFAPNKKLIKGTVTNFNYHTLTIFTANLEVWQVEPDALMYADECPGDIQP